MKLGLLLVPLARGVLMPPKNLLPQPTFLYKELVDESNLLRSVKWVYDSHRPGLDWDCRGSTGRDTDALGGNGMTKSKLDSFCTSVKSGRGGSQDQFVQVYDQILRAWILRFQKKLEGASQKEVASFKHLLVPAEVYRRPIYYNLTLVIPAAQRNIHRTITFLQSLHTVSNLPGELIFITTTRKGTIHTAFVRHAQALVNVMATRIPDLDRIRIRWAIFDSNGGAQDARWVGSKLATGAYVMYFDNDDFLGPAAFSRPMTILQERPDIDMTLVGYKPFLLSSKPKLRKSQKLCRSTGIRGVEQAKYVDYFDTLADHVLQLGKSNSQSDDAKMARKFDLAFERKKNGEHFFEWEESRLYFPGSIHGFTNIDHMTIDECRTTLMKVYRRMLDEHVISQKILNMFVRSPRGLKGAVSFSLDSVHLNDVLSEDQRAWELHDIRYFEFFCGSHIRSAYVPGCHNGWVTGKKSAMERIPPSKLKRGQDALNTWQAIMLNNTLVCDRTQETSVYFTYDPEVSWVELQHSAELVERCTS